MSDVTLRTLVLNKNFMPHSVFPLSTVLAREAICGYLTGKVDVVDWYDRPILTPPGSRKDLRWPAVVVTQHAKKFMNKVKLNKETLYYRENGACFWCDVPLTNKKHQKNTITDDHVIPISRGGKTEWVNVVACCAECNKMKGNALPTGKWTPKKKIIEPTFYQMLEIRKKYPLTVDHESWVQFLPGFVDTVVHQNYHSKPELRLVG